MRLIARYAQELKSVFEIVTVYDTNVDREEVDKENPKIKTLSHEHPAALWFERKMQDDFGIVVEDAFDTRPLLHQEYFPKKQYPMRKDFHTKQLDHSAFEPYDYELINGDGVFHVGVGPIHAGIIEPGHFHFSQAGESMLHLEVRHFYKYRAIEKMVEGKTLEEAKPIVERISGNETIAYQMCLRDIVLQASKQTLCKGLQKRHALLLELERMIHHLTDVGFIPNDAGFGVALAFGSKLAEDARRKMKEITGHRFGFGAITFENKDIDGISFGKWIDSMSKSIEYFENWITDIPSLWDRFDTTGQLPLSEALKYDSVGVVARGSGVEMDRRQTDFYVQHGFTLACEKGTDVAARFKVRISELKNSLKMMRNLLETDDSQLKIEPPHDGEYMSFTESSMGELFMSIVLKKGVIERFFVRDASFMNWQVLHVMMTKDIIADFPLINKSCDLSYAGNDL